LAAHSKLKRIVNDVAARSAPVNGLELPRSFLKLFRRTLCITGLGAGLGTGL
jgi:hypothetical protein